MPNRVIRGELLEAEPWLGLKDNADRCCFLACLLTADNFGDMPAGAHRLVKLWRPFGIDNPEKAAKVLGDLADVDLIRRYEVGGKPYLHIPRFDQRCRHIGHAWPLSPWATIEQKQLLIENSSANRGQWSAEVEVEVESIKNELRIPRARDPVDNSTEKAAASWQERWQTQGKAWGINPLQGESAGDYCRRVQALAKATNLLTP